MGNTERAVSDRRDEDPPRSRLELRTDTACAAPATAERVDAAGNDEGETQSSRAPACEKSPAPARPAGRLGLSIGQKLALLISCLQLAIIGCLALFFEQLQAEALSDELREKADTYAQLVAAQVRSAVAFGDRETAREVFDAVSSDPDLLAAVLYDQRGRVLHSWGTPGEVAANASGGVNARKVFDLPDRTLGVSPVVSLEGPRGVLTLEFSKQELEHSRSKLHQLALIAGGLALLVGTCMALVIAQSFARRLRAIAGVAERVAGGDLTQQPVADLALDEVGSMARSFAAMLDQIKRLFKEAGERAAEEQTRLETLVALRTKALEDRNADMRRVLDNVEQGFLTINRAGVMSPERSAVVERWLGPAPASSCFFEYVDSAAPGTGANLNLCWNEVIDGFLPVELTVSQLPRRFEKEGQYFAIDYRPIMTRDSVDGAVVVLSDITPTIQKERAEAEQREAFHLFTYLSKDRAGVAEFFEEAARLIYQVTVATPSDPSVTKRLIHTLKGNASVFGVERLSQLCHEIEDIMAETNTNIGQTERKRLADCWNTIHSKLAHLVEDSSATELSISEKDYTELLAALRQGGRSSSSLIPMVEAWRLEPTEIRLQRAARQANALVERLGKGPVEIRVESNRLRLERERWASVWAELPHLIRNAIDHGLETRAQRLQQGKPEVATLSLRTFIEGTEFTIEVSDSGQGVDWRKVRQCAEARGLPAKSHADLEAALFSDGLSTNDSVGETSGRGVGMPAVKAAVEARGGHVQVLSEPTQGTRVRLIWPVSSMSSV